MVKTTYEKVNEIINRFILLRQKQRWYDIKLASTNSSSPPRTPIFTRLRKSTAI